MKLILASSSPYRVKMLAQLRLPFDTCSPGIDETPLAGEAVDDYVLRLAEAKARAVAARYPDSLVIGSDQACTLNGLILGKPADADAARKHLKLCSGAWVEFRTGLALLNTATGTMRKRVEAYRVKFRTLADDEIRGYIRLDNPLDCAGCFKVEAAGIALFDALDGRDYHTLLGLPMIALVDMLREEGLNPLLAPGYSEPG
jgi:MAF protein